MDPTQAQWTKDGDMTVLTLDNIRFAPDGTIMFESGECQYEGTDPQAFLALIQHGQERAQA